MKRHSIWRLPVHTLGFKNVKAAVIGIPTVLATFFTLLSATGNIVLAIATTFVTWLGLNIALTRRGRTYRKKIRIEIETA